MWCRVICHPATSMYSILLFSKLSLLHWSCQTRRQIASHRFYSSVNTWKAVWTKHMWFIFVIAIYKYNNTVRGVSFIIKLIVFYFIIKNKWLRSLNTRNSSSVSSLCLEEIPIYYSKLILNIMSNKITYEHLLVNPFNRILYLLWENKTF